MILPEADSAVGTTKAASDESSAAEHELSIIDGVRLHAVRFAGVRDYAEDHAVKIYADGAGFLGSTPATDSSASEPGSSAASSSSSSLARRHHGAGFNYNWQRFDYNGGFLSELDLRIMTDWRARLRATLRCGRTRLR